MKSGLGLGITIEDAFKRKVKVGWLRKVVEAVLRSQRVEGSAEMSLVIAGDELVQRLNQEYRDVDRTTDVLSFALQEETEGETFVMPSDGIRHLGEVIISYPQAVRQAEEQKHSVERELALLIVHGILHLLGHNHEEDEDGVKMRTLESEILEELWPSGQ